MRKISIGEIGGTIIVVVAHAQRNPNILREDSQVYTLLSWITYHLNLSEFYVNILTALLFCLMFSPVVSAIEGATAPPSVILAKTYDAATSNIQLQDYWVSEKLDGVRGYWDGKNFISRKGNKFNRLIKVVTLKPYLRILNVIL